MFIRVWYRFILIIKVILLYLLYVKIQKIVKFSIIEIFDNISKQGKLYYLYIKNLILAQ